jgi:adenylate cyclase
MPFTQSIAAKIFGLALFLLVLTIGLAVFLLFEVGRTRTFLEVVSKRDIPLTASVSRIHEYGLRRRLAFERWFGALNAAAPNAEIVAEASKNYEIFAVELQDEFKNARTLMASYPKDHVGHDTLVEVAAILNGIEPMYPSISARQREVLDLQRAGQHERANDLLDVLNDLQRAVQTQRETAQTKMEAMTAMASAEASRREGQVFRLTAAATTSTGLLGLTVAWLITGRLTRPVRSLVTAMHDVRGGNLDVHLPVDSRDEVGALTDSFNFFVQELRSKDQLKRTFGKYIDPRVLEHVLEQPTAATAAGGRCVMTVMFADLAGFTSLSERLTPSLMVTVLNRHFGLQALAVQAHFGIVDKFVGDSVMAFWGPPFVGPDDYAVLACRAALAQLGALDVLRQELPELTGLRRDAPELDLRIGLCTGEVVVGNIGSENTRSYTVIGDTVNLTARIEGANRIYRTKALLGESTARAVGDRFVTRELDAIAVKGKTEPTRIFELQGAAGGVADDALRLRDRYAEALREYRAQRWDRAEAGFRECAALRAGDGPSAVFLERIRALRQAPPAGDWDGVWRLAEQ